MSRWRKTFDKWRNTREAAPYDQVEPLVRRVFGERVDDKSSGTSHQLEIDVHELAGHGGAYRFGRVNIVVKHGQKVNRLYLNTAYDAAVLLELYPPAGLEGEDIDD